MNDAFLILSSSGDEAEAVGLENAIAAARQLVRDGNRTAHVRLNGSPVGFARRADHGDDAVVFVTTDLAGCGGSRR